jgi:hypothetical protein
MAHAAELDANNVVLRVIVVSNDLEPNVEQWCEQTYGGTWRQTSYNANFRGHYAGVGYTFRPDLGEDGVFLPPQPYPSWRLNMMTFTWKAPAPMPQDGGMYVWDEDALSWRDVTPQENP